MLPSEGDEGGSEGGDWEGRVALPPSPSWYGAHLGDWDTAGRRFTYVAGGTLVVLQPENGRVTACLTPPPVGCAKKCARGTPRERYSAIRFLPGPGLGSFLVAARSGSPGELHFWDTLSGELLHRSPLPLPPQSKVGDTGERAKSSAGPWPALEVHPGRPGAVLCAGDSGLVVLAGVARTFSPVTVASLASSVTCLAWRDVPEVGPSPGIWAAVGLRSGHLALLQVPQSAAARAGLPVESPPPAACFLEGAHDGDVQSLEWASGGGGRLLSAGRDRVVKIWEVEELSSQMGSGGIGAPSLRLVARLKLPGGGAAQANSDGGRSWVSAAWTEPSWGGTCQGVVASLESGDLAWWVQVPDPGPSLVAEGVPQDLTGPSVSDSTYKQMAPLRLRSGHSRPIFLLALRPERAGGAPLLASLSMDRQVRFILPPGRVQNGKANGKVLALAWAVPGLGAFPYCVVPSPFLPGIAACGAGDGCVRVWSLDGSYPPVALWRGLSGERVRAVAWSPVEDGVLAYGTEKGAVGLLRLAAAGPGRAGRMVGGHSGPVNSLTWLEVDCPRDRGAGPVELHNGLETGAVWTTAPRLLLLLSCAGDGRALWRCMPLSGPGEGGVHRPQHPLSGELPFCGVGAGGAPSPVSCAQWTPEAGLLASGHACGAVLLSRIRFEGSSSPSQSFSSPSSSFLPGGWEAAVTARLKAHPCGPVAVLSWDHSSFTSGDGVLRLASGATEGSVALTTAEVSESRLDPKSWEVAWRDDLPGNGCRALAFSPDGRSLAVGGPRGAWVYDLAALSGLSASGSPETAFPRKSVALQQRGGVLDVAWPSVGRLLVAHEGQAVEDCAFVDTRAGCTGLLLDSRGGQSYARR